jgi:hypothetical protein
MIAMPEEIRSSRKIRNPLTLGSRSTYEVAVTDPFWFFQLSLEMIYESRRWLKNPFFPGAGQKDENLEVCNFPWNRQNVGSR